MPYSIAPRTAELRVFLRGSASGNYGHPRITAPAAATEILRSLETMKRPRFFPIWLLPALVFSGSHAATVTKNDTTSLQANTINWSAAPASVDIGSFTAALSATNAANLTLGGDLSIGNLTFGVMNGPVVITDARTLTLNNATPLSATAATHGITFNHAVTFSSTGTSTFETNNTVPSASITFNGTLNSNGKVFLRAGNAVFSGGGNYTSIGIGSRSGVTSTISIGANNGISTSASFSLGEANGTSRFDLAGFNQSLVGISKLNAGTTAIIGNSSTTSDSVLTLTGTSSYSGLIQDSINSGTKNVGIVINGGSLTLSANHTYTGDTVIKSGTLKLDAGGNLQGSENIIIGDSGSSGTVLDVTTKTTGFTIGGAQTVGGIGHLDATGNTVTLNGRLAPGNSAGKLNVTTSGLTIGSGGILSLELTRGVPPNAGVNYDQLGLAGALTIDPAATLELTALGTGDWNVNDIFFFILNDGTDSINGSFAGYAEGSTFTLASQSFKITYQADGASSSFAGGNDMAIQVIPESGHALLGSIGILLLLRRRR